MSLVWLFVPFQPIVQKSQRNQRGQGLIEYMIIVALMGVATIAIVRILGEQVSNRFSSITYALQGKESSLDKVKVDANSYKRKDLGDFMKGVGHKGDKKSEGDK